MKLLALDTSAERCSVAVLAEGRLHERAMHGPREHARHVLPLVDAVLAEAGLVLTNLDALAFGCGPGSFTGLRVACGVVQGLAFAADRPVVPVSSLAALAHGAARASGQERVLAALDARMGQVYWGAYHVPERGEAALQGGERVCDPADVPVPDNAGWLGAGPGWRSYEATLTRRLAGRIAAVQPACEPEAADVAWLAATEFQRGGWVSPEMAQPRYLRNEVAQKPVR